MPVYAAPPEAEVVGWVSNPDGPGFVMRATAAEVFDQVGGDDAWCTPYPVYRRAPVEPDWPRSIPPSMAEAYGETLSLALQDGADHPGAARAVLDEFMASHRPAPLGGTDRARLAELEAKLDALTVPDRSATAWRSWTPGEHGTRLWALEEAARTAAGPDGRVTPLYDAPPREPVPADLAEVPCAFVEEDAGGKLRRFYLGSEAEAARRGAAHQGYRCVPLYRAPEPPHLPEPAGYMLTVPASAKPHLKAVVPTGREDVRTWPAAWREDAERTAGEMKAELVPLYALK